MFRKRFRVAGAWSRLIEGETKGRAEQECGNECHAKEFRLAWQKLKYVSFA